MRGDVFITSHEASFKIKELHQNLPQVTLDLKTDAKKTNNLLRKHSEAFIEGMALLQKEKSLILGQFDKMNNSSEDSN